MAKSKKTKRDAKKEKKNYQKIPFLNIIKKGLFYGTAFFLAFCIFVFLWLWNDFPDLENIKPGIKRQSIVYLNRQHVEIGRHGDLAGDVLESDALPDTLKKALFAIEDSRFMNHIGIDMIGIMRALYHNIKARHMVQGGSTLTQQIAKNVFLTPKRSIKRKLQEFFVALFLEKKFTKNQLLTIYFNRVYFGSGVYGINAAAQEYFGIPAVRINLAQACVLVSLLKAPSRLSPYNNPEQTKKRAYTVALRLLDLEYVSKERYDQLIQEIHLLTFQKSTALNNSGYFIDKVRHEIKKYTSSKKDLIVITTLNTQLQKNASKTLKEKITQAQKYDVSQGAFVALQIDGAIAALVGGLDYNQSSFNRAWQAKRQLGSLFKLFVYCAGLENGVRIQDMYTDTPPIISGWRPRNYGWKERGRISVLDGFTYSVNAIAVRIAHKIGIDKVIEMAQRFQLNQHFEPNLSTALGSGSTSLLEITRAFTTFANKGRPIMPYAILEIWDTDGTLLYKRPKQRSSPPIISEYVYQNMQLLLNKANKFGTGRRAYIENFSKGSKTGTSQNFKDAWFIGLTPNLIASVWVGNDNEKPMKKITGGRLPAEIWKEIFLKGLVSNEHLKASNDVFGKKKNHAV
jgi:penicillin-binding protein 1A